MKGAPLRFAAAVVGGWVIGRVVVLLPAAAPLVEPALEDEARVIGRVAQIDTAPDPDVQPRHSILPAQTRIVEGIQTIAVRPKTSAEATSIQPTLPVGTGAVQPAQVTVEAASPTSLSPSPSPSPAQSLSVPASRLSIDAWLVARPGGGDNLAFGQLGASQGGVRLTYALGRRLALSGRVSMPLHGTGREIGLGIDLKPTRLPLHLLVEQRVDLDSGATRPAVIAIAGTSAALPWRARIDAYAQTGAVLRRGGFADGAVLVTRPILTHGDSRLEAGAGAWGAAQREVARLDVGPSIALVTPGAGGTLRLQLDYRARITGRARPGSGPALTLGSSF